MTDKLNIKEEIILDFLNKPRTRKGRSPYKLDRQYTDQELLKLTDYMHQEFQHLSYGGERSKGIIVEYSPPQIAQKHIWKAALDAILIPELATLNPKVRDNKTIIRFDSGIYDESKNISVLGSYEGGNYTNGEMWIKVSSYDSRTNRFTDIKDAVFIIMHEIFEIDFWSKTHETDNEAYNDHKKSIGLLTQNTNDYSKLLDEKVANRRAVKAMRRYWPDFDLDLDYEEDKD